jgi:formate dehydrogenase maturation protein FdhE
MNYSEFQEDEIETEKPVIEKLSLADRIARDKAARARRRETKQVLQIHSYKEEKDARERLRAKRLLAKQKKQKK